MENYIIVLLCLTTVSTVVLAAANYFLYRRNEKLVAQALEAENSLAKANQQLRELYRLMGHVKSRSPHPHHHHR